MGVFGWIIGAGVVGGLIHKSGKKAREEAKREEKRQNTPCHFSDDFSKSDFEIIAVRSAKNIKRLSISVEGPIIYGTVQSQSGISEWFFKADFNDYGHVTGHYWLSSDNSDSSIPKHYAENVANLIRNFDPDDYDYNEFSNRKSFNCLEASNSLGNFCRFCGEKLTLANSKFCPYCGKRLI